eukprot:Rhum_TRINITY_DN14257_c0_g1::Rhum_TRINITY_DN14257_c0_g1_i1::g.76018::m.76018
MLLSVGARLLCCVAAAAVSAVAHQCIHDHVSAPPLLLVLAEHPDAAQYDAGRLSAEWKPLVLHVHELWGADGSGSRACVREGQLVAVGTPPTNSTHVCWRERGVHRNCWVRCAAADVMTTAKRAAVRETMARVAAFVRDAVKVSEEWGRVALRNGTACNGVPVPRAAAAAAASGTRQHVVLLTDEPLTQHAGAAAYSLPCQHARDYRPVLSSLVVSPARAVPAAALVEGSPEADQLFAVLLHEVVHCLGFSRALYSKMYPRRYLNTDNVERRTYAVANAQRFPYGPVLGPAVQGVVGGDAVFNFTAADATVVSGGSGSGSGGGKRAAYFTTPALRRAGSEHYGCARLLDEDGTRNGDALGVEVEDAAPSHFEKRVLFDELMTVEVTGVVTLTSFTLAFLNDTGWYRTRAAAAQGERPRHGRGGGCGYLTPGVCAGGGAGGGGGDEAELCSSDEALSLGCSADGATASVCTVQSHLDFFAEAAEGYAQAGPGLAYPPPSTLEGVRRSNERRFGSPYVGGDRAADYCGYRRRVYYPPPLDGSRGVRSCTSLLSPDAAGTAAALAQCFESTVYAVQAPPKEFLLSQTGVKCQNAEGGGSGSGGDGASDGSSLWGDIVAAAACRDAAAALGLPAPEAPLVRVSDESLPRGCVYNWEEGRLLLNEVLASAARDPTGEEFVAYVTSGAASAANYRTTPLCALNGGAPLPACHRAVCHADGGLYVQAGSGAGADALLGGRFFRCPAGAALVLTPAETPPPRLRPFSAAARPGDVVVPTEGQRGRVACPDARSRCSGAGVGGGRDVVDIPWPAVTSAKPRALAIDGGDLVAVTGANLTDACEVWVGGEQAEVLSVEAGGGALFARVEPFVRQGDLGADEERPVDLAVACPQPAGGRASAAAPRICDGGHPNCLAAVLPAAFVLSAHGNETGVTTDAPEATEAGGGSVPWHIVLAVVVGACTAAGLGALLILAYRRDLFRKAGQAEEEEEERVEMGYGPGGLATPGKEFSVSQSIEPLDMAALKTGGRE